MRLLIISCLLLASALAQTVNPLAIQRLKALQAKKHMLRKTRGGFDFDGPDDDDFAAMMALSGQMPFYPFMMDDMDDMFDDVFDDDYLPYAWMFGQSPFFPSFPTPTVSSDDTAAPTFPMFPFFDFDLSKANPQASRKMKQQYVRHQLRKAHQLRKTRADPTPTSKPTFPFLPFMMDDFFDFDFPFEFDDYLPYAMMFGNNASGMMKPFTDMFSSFFPTMDSTTTPSFPMWPFFMDELSKSNPSQQFKNRLMKHQLRKPRQEGAAPTPAFPFFFYDDDLFDDMFDDMPDMFEDYYKYAWMFGGKMPQVPWNPFYWMYTTPTAPPTLAKTHSNRILQQARKF